MLIDDEPDITLALSMVLEVNGFVVNTFNDTQLVLQSFKEEESFALALLDINMPDERVWTVQWNKKNRR